MPVTLTGSLRLKLSMPGTDTAVHTAQLSMNNILQFCIMSRIRLYGTPWYGTILVSQSYVSRYLVLPPWIMTSFLCHMRAQNGRNRNFYWWYCSVLKLCTVSFITYMRWSYFIVQLGGWVSTHRAGDVFIVTTWGVTHFKGFFRSMPESIAVKLSTLK